VLRTARLSGTATPRAGAALAEPQALDPAGLLGRAELASPRAGAAHTASLTGAARAWTAGLPRATTGPTNVSAGAGTADGVIPAGPRARTAGLTQLAAARFDITRRMRVRAGLQGCVRAAREWGRVHRRIRGCVRPTHVHRGAGRVGRAIGCGVRCDRGRIRRRPAVDLRRAWAVAGAGDDQHQPQRRQPLQGSTAGFEQRTPLKQVVSPRQTCCTP
jgi:hypothetical protein